MDLLQNMNRAMQYVEEHLTEEIDMNEVSKQAYCSEYHFKRMFSFLAGIPLSEYIRRRRLTMAGLELTQSELRIIDIALKYGYNSPDSFTRAFVTMHGVTPSEARNNGSLLKAYPRMIFQLTIKGGSEMNYRFEEQDAFQIVGIMKRVPIKFQGVNPEIVSMLDDLTEERIRFLKQLSNMKPAGILSASTNFSEGRMDETGELDHYIGVATTHACPDDLAYLEVPAGTWAVFEAVGPYPETLQEVWGRIYSEWFPSTGYQQTVGPEILWHENQEMSSPVFRSEIWIPVTKNL